MEVEKREFWSFSLVSRMMHNGIIQLNDQSIARAVKQLREKEEITFGPFKKQEGMRVDGEGRLFRKRALVVPRSRRTGVTEITHRVTHSGLKRPTCICKIISTG